MSRPDSRVFRDDVVRVARHRDDDVTIEQIATDFGVRPTTLHRWMRRADIDVHQAREEHQQSCELREAPREIKPVGTGK